jgi:hypothetical protein
VSAPGADAERAYGGADEGMGAVETRSDPPPVETQRPEPQWLGPIQARIDELTAQQQQVTAALAERFGASDYDDEPGDGFGYEDETGLHFSPEELAQIDALIEADEGDGDDRQAFDAEMGETAADQVWQALQDERAQAALGEREDAFAELVDELPILRSERSGDLAHRIVLAAAEEADRIEPGLTDSPQFVDFLRLFALEAMGRVRAGQPPVNGGAVDRRGLVDEGPGEVYLEPAGGAEQRPAQPTSEDQWGDRIVAAAEKLRPRI